MKLAQSAVIFLVIAWGVGCAHYRLEHDAPGHVDLSRPPADTSKRYQEQPADAGQREVVFSAGGFAFGGARFGDASANGACHGMGVELSVLYGESPFRDVGFFAYGLPMTAVGLNFGWEPFNDERKTDRFYFTVEGKAKRVISVSGGAELQNGGRTWGGQLTAGFGPLFVRTVVMPHHGATVMIGTFLKPSFSLAWNR
jgi:hypothetical protein